MRLAAFRTISTSLGYIKNGIRNLSLSDLADTLEETVRNHLEELNNTNSQAALEPQGALTGKQASAYARAGIDITNASPLLLIALSQADPQATPAPVSTEKVATPSGRAALRDAYRAVLSLATWLGPLRRFVLAHPLGTLMLRVLGSAGA